MNKIKKEYIIFLVILIVAMVGSFFGGMKYQENKGVAKFGQMQQWQMQGQMQQGQRQGVSGNMTRQKGGLVGGQILSINDKSMVLKDRSGGSKIIFFSDTTQYLKSVSGSIGDVSVGSNITVTGNQNSDGSVTAKIIQISSQSVQGGQDVPNDKVK